MHPPRTRTLTINLSTGTGTLVHEFTHALHFSDMEARGQMHPTWVREGLGHQPPDLVGPLRVQHTPLLSRV